MAQNTHARRAHRADVTHRAAALGIALLVACSSDTSIPTATDQQAGGAPVEPPPPAAVAVEPELIAGQYLVTFVDTVTDVRGLARRLAAQHGTDTLVTWTAAIKGFAVRIPDQAVDALRKNPNVKSIEQDALIGVEGSGTQASAPWSLDRIDQLRMPLNGTYAYATDGAGVNVYIIDSGIRTTHRDLAGRAFGAFTAIADGNGTDDCLGHGTGVADVVAGSTYGVAKGARVYAVRVVDCSGTAAYSALVSGIDWVTKNRVLPAVANVSIAGSASSTVNTAVENSIAAGVVYAVAAANYSADACNYSPASARSALTVAASTRDITSSYDVQASYSNYGPCVDLYAPGSAIRSATNTSDTATTVWSGTSFASPHVAGVAALYLSTNPSATPSQVASAILGSAATNLVGSAGAGTPNLLLQSGTAGGAAPPPTDTTTAPPPPPPSTTPTPTFTVNGCPRSNCTFDGSGSFSPNGIASYAWNFGDGGTSSASGSGAKVSHAYAGKGTYIVTLTVVDNAGQTASLKQTVSIKR